MKMGIMRLAHMSMVSATALMATTAPAYAQQAEARRDFNIRAQPLASALNEFSRQSDIVVTAPARLTRQRSAPAVRGSYTPREALQALLSGSGLTYRAGRGGTFIIEQGTPAQGEAAAGSAPAESERAAAGATPEILVIGRRTINADIRRTEDDAQPYVTFDAEQIEQSAAGNVEDFLRTRLPMNTQRGTFTQDGGANAANGNQSRFNLRGLGANQTLILVDGRRMPGINNFGDFAQPDINGIPLAAIERIEVLPSTASGIYGGGATGGVINIITRKDYTGVDVGITYRSPFEGGGASRRLDFSGGLSLNGGRTSILLAASYADADPLRTSDRDFAARARSLQLANNPAAFLTPATPPIGFTSNIRSQNGSNLVLDNGTPLNSPRTFVPIGYAGPSTDGGAALVANAGLYNLDIPDTLQGGRVSLLNDPTVWSATLNIRHAFSTRVEVFLDLSHSDNRGHALGGLISDVVTLPANAPNNPFTTPINVRFSPTGLIAPIVSASETTRAVGGVIVRLPREWTVSADLAWNRSRFTQTSTNPILGDPDGAGPGLPFATDLTNGTLDVLRDLNAFPLDYAPYLFPSPNQFSGPVDTVLLDATLRVSGPVLRLPAGPVTLSALFERREEDLKDVLFDTGPGAAAASRFRLTAAASQNVNSYYLETRVPLFSSANALPLLRELELQASVRHDTYETRLPAPAFVFSSAREGPFPPVTYNTNNVEGTGYTVGVRYSPIRDLVLRASYGTGFLPPSVTQLRPSLPSPPVTLTLVDPKRGGVSSTFVVDLFSGGNLDLVPEESESWSIGGILTPRFLPGLRLSVDYTRIEKTDEISGIVLAQILSLEDDLPGRVTRAPLTDADRALGFTGGVITSIDTRAVNIARTRVEAYDFQADYTLRTERLGTFHLYAVATWQPHFQRQTTARSAAVDSVGFSNGQLEWRGNAGLNWESGPWTLGWNAQYYGSYRPWAATDAPATINAVVLNQGSDTIPSQTYHDVFLRYRFGADARFPHVAFANTEILLGIQNIFDQSPPILASTGTTGGYSTYGDPRLRRFSISVRKHF